MKLIHGGGRETGTHAVVWDLLPWYVNGTLEDGELDRVEAHLSGCAACRAEAEDLRRLARGLTASEDLGEREDPDRAWRRMTAKLARTRATSSGRSSVPPNGGRPQRRWSLVSWVALAEAAVIVVLLGIMVFGTRSPASSPASEYRLMGEPVHGGGGIGPRLKVLFNERASAGEIRELLRGLGGQIVEGPSPYGNFVVELERSAADWPSSEELEALRTRPEIEFLTVLPR